MMSTRPASPPLVAGGVERLLVHEVVAQDLGGEGVEQLLVGVREPRRLVVGELSIDSAERGRLGAAVTHAMTVIKVENVERLGRGGGVVTVGGEHGLHVGWRWVQPGHGG